MRRALQVCVHINNGLSLDRSWWCLQARRKLIHDYRRARPSVPKAEEVPTGQKGRYQTCPPLRVVIPRTESSVTSPAQSPTTTRSTTSSISSLASIEKDGDGAETETDTDILRRYYLKKVEGRFERAYEGVEKADMWLKIVKRVLEDVDRRGLDEVL
jgi:hypothetical protein